MEISGSVAKLFNGTDPNFKSGKTPQLEGGAKAQNRAKPPDWPTY